MNIGLNRTAFERLVSYLERERIHHPRTGFHSDYLSKEFLRDLYHVSSIFKSDVDAGTICYKVNHRLGLGGRQHVLDLVLGTREDSSQQTSIDPKNQGFQRIRESEPKDIRLIMENKSLITAHRNVYNRTRILADLAEAVRDGQHRHVLLVGTFIIGTADKFLNYETFIRARDVLSHLCSESKFNLKELEGMIGTGNEKIREFVEDPALPETMISRNKPDEPEKTLDIIIQDVPIKQLSGGGYDGFAIQFCHLDNIDRPRLEDPLVFKDKKYEAVRYENALETIAAQYDEKYE